MTDGLNSSPIEKDRFLVSYIIPDLSGGGAEKVLIHLLNNLPREKYDLELVLLKKSGVYHEHIPKDVSIQIFNLSKTRNFTLPLFKYLRTTKARVLVIFNVNNINLIIILAKLLFPKKFKIISREATILSKSIENHSVIFRYILRFLHQWALKLADKVIALSSDMKNDLILNFNVKFEKLIVINNPVLPVYASYKKYKSSNSSFAKQILCMGRLEPQKRFHLIIEAFSRLQRNDVSLIIVGDSDNEIYKRQLKQLIEYKGIKEQVKFVGRTNDPNILLKNSDVLAIASTYEGFPNVVVEANAMGVPVIGFKTIGGHNDIIHENINGNLVPEGDIDAYAEALENLLNSNLEPSRIINITMKRYSLNKVIGMYDKVISELIYGAKA